MDQGVEILFKELDLIFPAGSKYSEPPSIPLLYLEGLLPSSVASLLVDCLESAIVAQFAKHLAYNQPNIMFYEKKLMKPPPISSARLIHVCKTQLNEWIEYPKSHGTDNDILLKEMVKVEGKLYFDLQEDIARVKIEITDSVFDDLIKESILDIVISKNDFLTDPIIEASKDENLLSKAGEQPAVIHIGTDLAAEIKSPVTNETIALQSLSSKPILAKIID
jgi:hypothetical protein